jgi:hypothetical protein
MQAPETCLLSEQCVGTTSSALHAVTLKVLPLLAVVKARGVWHCHHASTAPVCQRLYVCQCLQLAAGHGPLGS